VTDAAHADGAAIGWTVYLGAAPTALGFATWAIALRRTSAGRMASLTYLIPLVAIVLGWAVLGETPRWLAASGGVLCLAGVVLARRRTGPVRVVPDTRTAPCGPEVRGDPRLPTAALDE
jgi:drug/metabolite transporter (DMT)-like permease